MKDMQQTEFLWFGTNRRSNIAKVNKSHPLDLPILEISKKFIPDIVLYWLFKVSNNNVMELLGLVSRCCPILNFCVKIAQNHLEIAYKAYQTVQLVSFLETKSLISSLITQQNTRAPIFQDCNEHFRDLRSKRSFLQKPRENTRKSTANANIHSISQNFWKIID